MPPAGVSSDGLTITEQPAASAPPILRTTLIIGKFHAAKPATGPIGWYCTSTRWPVGRTSVRP